MHGSVGKHISSNLLNGITVFGLCAEMTEIFVSGVLAVNLNSKCSRYSGPRVFDEPPAELLSADGCSTALLTQHAPNYNATQHGKCH